MQFSDYKKEKYKELVDLWALCGVGGAHRGDTPDVLQRTLDHGGHIRLLYIDDQIIGSSWITNDARRLYIHHFCIHPDYQGRGYSNTLIEDSLVICKSLGMQVKLEVHEENEAALYLYKKYAFKELGDYKVLIIREYQ